MLDQHVASWVHNIIEDDVEMVVDYDYLIESELQALLVEYELETDPKGLEVW